MPWWPSGLEGNKGAGPGTRPGHVIDFFSNCRRAATLFLLAVTYFTFTAAYFFNLICIFFLYNSIVKFK